MLSESLALTTRQTDCLSTSSNLLFVVVMNERDANPDTNYGDVFYHQSRLTEVGLGLFNVEHPDRLSFSPLFLVSPPFFLPQWGKHLSLTLF